MPPPERWATAGLWQRELGRLPPKRFTNAVIASQDFVHSLNIHKRLRKHRGCVNTISFNADGSLLLSGSDDRTVTLWKWEAEAPALSFHTGHSNNVLHAQFMHLSNDRSIVSCAADGEVRYSQIKEGGGVVTDKLVELEYAIHRLAVVPGSPNMVYCCCQDSSVWLFDLRGKHAEKLFNCGSVLFGEANELFAISIDPRKLCSLAVAGSDEYVRLFDTRKIYMDGNSMFGRPIEYFCPPHLIGDHKGGLTGLAFSQTSELLASYCYDNIYLFEREHGLLHNNIEVSEQLLIYEPERPSHTDRLPKPKSFKGHQNVHTVKGVNFLGPDCDYVTSGSDCGNIFVWRKKDEEIIRAMRGDSGAINCVEQHPSGIVVASSGIENDIKIWEPGESDDPTIGHIDVDDTDGWLNYSSDDSDAFVYMGDIDIVMASDEDYLYDDDENGEDEEDTSEDLSE